MFISDARTINPMKIIGANYQAMKKRKAREKAEKLSKQSKPQAHYFGDLFININTSIEQILIAGYDAVFMEQPKTIEYLRNAANGVDRNPSRGKFRNGKLDVRVIIPESVETPELEKLAEESIFFRLFRSPEEMTGGFMVFDYRSVGIWNSKKPTTYLPETEKGVILRTLISYNYYAVERFIRKYNSLEDEIQQNVK